MSQRGSFSRVRGSVPGNRGPVFLQAVQGTERIALPGRAADSLLQLLANGQPAGLMLVSLGDLLPPPCQDVLVAVAEAQNAVERCQPRLAEKLTGPAKFTATRRAAGCRLRRQSASAPLTGLPRREIELSPYLNSP